MNSNMASLPELPIDLITMILSCLPVESLLRFKCVCRQWYALIQHPNFIALHNRQATPVFLPDARTTAAGRVHLILSFAGLLLEKNIRTGKYVIRNPAIRQVLDLPDPHPLNAFMFASFNSRTSECKLFATYFQSNQGSIEFNWEILSVGRDENWRALSLHCSDEENRNPVCWCYFKTDRRIHYVRPMKIEQDLEIKIVSLDIWTESLRAVTLPRRFFSDSSEVFLFLWDDCVSVADVIDEKLHVLVLKKHKTSKIIVPLNFLEEKGYAKEKLLPAEAKSDDLWFRFEQRTKICCDAKTGRIKEIRLQPEASRNQIEYRPSLVNLQGMRPEGNQG